MTALYTVKGLFAQRTLFSLAGLLKRRAAGRGRPLSLRPLEQALLVRFKLRYNLPDRVLEVLFGVGHVTVSRDVRRALALMTHAPRALAQPGAWYAVDTTTIRIGRGKRRGHYTGYKHLQRHQAAGGGQRPGAAGGRVGRPPGQCS